AWPRRDAPGLRASEHSLSRQRRWLRPLGPARRPRAVGVSDDPGGHLEANRAVWDTWTAHDLTSDHHRAVEIVRAGGSTLRSIERDELGEVAGKTLLHLQCNMGADTLSW